MRPNVDPGAGRAVREHEVGDPDDGPVDGRVDVRAGCGADGERRCQARRGPAAGTRRAGSPWSPTSRCQRRGRRSPPADGVECQRTVARVVVPDRSHGRLGDGELELHRAGCRDDLWQWLAARQHVGGRERLGGDRCRAPGAERSRAGSAPRPPKKRAARTKRVAWRWSRRRAQARRSLVARRPHRVRGQAEAMRGTIADPAVALLRAEALPVPRIPSTAWLTDGRRSRFRAGFSWPAPPACC